MGPYTISLDPAVYLQMLLPQVQELGFSLQSEIQLAMPKSDSTSLLPRRMLSSSHLVDLEQASDPSTAN